MREWLNGWMNNGWRRCGAVLAVAVPVAASGQVAEPQAVGEGAAEAAAPVAAASAPQRSELWMAVHAQGKPDADAAAQEPWHLSDGQRTRLREQVRRGMGAETGPAERLAPVQSGEP